MVLGQGCTPPSKIDAGPPTDAGVAPVFPIDFAERYTETRDCRSSHEHELRFIRVWVDDIALPIYQSYAGPYAVGSTLVKGEYDDEGCEHLVGYTAMHRRPPGENPPGGGGWYWQKLDEERRVIEDGAPIRCVDCHTHHCAPPFGHELTCAEELE